MSMSNKMIIRKETAEDYKASELMVMRAFWNIHGPGCNEHLLVRILRNSQDYLPEFSRVAEIDGKIAGAIYYSKAKVTDGNKEYDFVTFGPLAVEPTLQNTGVGRALMEETFKLVKAAGYPAVIIFGEPDYYPKVGFKRIGSYNITDADGNTWDAMMIYPMDNEALKNIKGIFTESPDFEKCDNEAAVREIEKEFPLYPKIKIQDGFLQIYGGRFGIIKAVEKDCYKVSFWELEIPAVLSKEVDKIPKAGDVVIFNWNNNGVSEITRICQNLI